MKKQVIRLTEAQLHKVIKETVKRIMRECDGGIGGAGMMGGGSNGAGDGATSTQITPDKNAAGYTPVSSGIINKKFQKPAMTKNNNGSVSVPDNKA